LEFTNPLILTFPLIVKLVLTYIELPSVKGPHNVVGPTTTKEDPTVNDPNILEFSLNTEFVAFISDGISGAIGTSTPNVLIGDLIGSRS
jgi:hypothetical protein